MITYLERSCFDVHLGTQQNTRHANNGEHHSLQGKQAKPDLQGMTAAAWSRVMAACCRHPEVSRKEWPAITVQLTPSWRLVWQAEGSSGCQPGHCCAAPRPAGFTAGKLNTAAGVSQSSAVQHVPSWCLAWPAGEAGR